MHTLKNHTLIFDSDCPLCVGYTSAFIRTNMLDKNGRMAYDSINENFKNSIDMKRARNEIALINTKTTSVVYGLESLFKIIGNNFPFLKTYFQFKLFRYLSEKLYKFISYNRKIIIPNNNQNNTCIPDFNLKYRLIYIVFAWLITSSLLMIFTSNIQNTVPNIKLFPEYIVLSIHLIIQGTLVYTINKHKVIEYVGNNCTISLFGALLLLPIIIFNKLIPETVQIIYFLGVAIVMFAEHARRVKLLKLPFVITCTWILYRIILLLTIILTL